MMNESLLLDTLLKKAEETNNQKVKDKLSSAEFLSALKIVEETSKSLGLVLSERNPDEDKLQDINMKISRALMNNYVSFYYVNVKTDEYTGYSTCEDYKSLNIEENGKNFFADLLVNVNKVVFEEDRDIVKDGLAKEKLISETANGSSYTLTYRLMIDDEPVYVTLKALKLAESDDNLIIGVSNIDDLKKEEIEIRRKMKKNITYSNIALALAKNFFAIYYVDINTNQYDEYKLDSENQKLIRLSSGDSFFEESIVNAKKLIYKDDLDNFLHAVEKKRLIKEVRNNKTFRLTYRQLIDNEYVYVSFSAISLINDATHILLGISNIDEQKRREIDFFRRLDIEKSIARTDGLTGANNKYSYNEVEKVLDDKMKGDVPLEISIVVCDINNLKQVNDTYGHAVGDNYIIEAKNLIANVFKNSSVYRVGGDEFVSILEGSDYYKRDHLLKELQDKVLKNQKENKVVVASGLADYDSKNDNCLNDVFVRADEAMYKNKQQLKENKN